MYLGNFDLNKFDYFKNVKILILLFLVITILVIYARLVTKKINKREAIRYFLIYITSAVIGSLLIPFILLGMLEFNRIGKVDISVVIVILLICNILKIIIKKYY